MQVSKSFGHLLGGTLLVTGTSIGVGMLALPVATAEGGFLPSLVVYLVCWLFMLLTGLLVLEACIWMPKDANLITLSRHLLGRSGKIACWILYLFLFSCLMVAHVVGGGSVLSQISNSVLPNTLATILYVLIFAPAVYLGTKSVDRLNLVLMFGVVISYFLFVFFSIQYINPSLLAFADWGKSWPALPIVFTAFGYQSLIPTLLSYMNRDVKKVRFAIIAGTSIPLLIYVVWELLILGIIPVDAPGGLRDALHKGESAVTPLGQYIQNPSIVVVGRAFAFFALTTSFVGIAIAFVDFLADGLKVQKKGMHKFLLCALIFIIPTIVALIDPTIFIKALNYAGGFGVALLLGAMPILMVWSGRYSLGLSLNHQQVRGGRFALSLLMAFIVFELAIQFTS
jgi:tyrosine-specific transport protein